MEKLASMHRANAFITYRSLGGKESIERIWPIKGDKKKGNSDTWIITKEMLDKIKKDHGVN